MDLAPPARAGMIGRGLALVTLAAAPLAAQTQVLVVSGLGGEPRYRSAFTATALAVGQAARERLGTGPDDVTILAEDAATPGVAGRSTREAIEARLRLMAQRAAPDGLSLVVFVGHGSADGAPRLNLPGPDLTPAELARMLDGFGGKPVVVVNGASASGDWIPALSGPGRAIVTATRSGLERNETHFAEHFAAALGSDQADRDKDGRLSLYEAFEYARREVARVYEREQRLQTEHALLEADGDKVGSRAPEPTAGDGGAAAGIFLDAGRTVAGGAASTGLAAVRDSLQREVAALRGRKATMPAAEYERRLEDLLLELARVNRSLRPERP
jgi:hypothetical protein